MFLEVFTVSPNFYSFYCWGHFTHKNTLGEIFIILCNEKKKGYQIFQNVIVAFYKKKIIKDTKMIIFKTCCLLFIDSSHLPNFFLVHFHHFLYVKSQCNHRWGGSVQLKFELYSLVFTTQNIDLESRRCFYAAGQFPWSEPFCN